MMTIITLILIFVALLFLQWLFNRKPDPDILYKEGVDLMQSTICNGDPKEIEELYNLALNAPDYNAFDKGIVDTYLAWKKTI